MTQTWVTWQEREQIEKGTHPEIAPDGYPWPSCWQLRAWLRWLYAQPVSTTGPTDG